MCGTVLQQAGVLMTTILDFIKTLIPRLEPQHVLDEAYLAESVDFQDLERRMRELERCSRSASLASAWSFGRH
jgi:hypothetical protein